MVVAVLVALPLVAQDEGWPKEIEEGEYTVTLYQPQVDVFTEDLIEGRAAVSVKKGAAEPTFGAVWIRARLATDRDTRNVDILTVEVPTVRFPEATEEEQRQLAELLEREIPTWDLDLSFDRLLASLEILEGQVHELELKNDPPKIIIANQPSLLVLIDGEPKLEDVEGSKLRRVVNTPFLIVYDQQSRAYYLSANEGWFSAREVMGPWRPEPSLPSEVVAITPPLPEATKEDEEAPKDARTPQIVVSTEPAELIFIDGDPAMKPIENTDLLYVSNTDSDVVFDIGAQRYYVLLSGRWFSSSSLATAAWTFVRPDELPETFASIPLDSENGHMLVSVAGTEQAREAVLDAAIPQTAAVKLDATTAVEYDGTPKFEPVEGTDMTYAVNTESQVIRYRDSYYSCDDGVWYVASGPTGPWKVATEIPKEIYDIPPSNPNHNVTYVHVYETTPEVVYVGYTPGYVGSYPYHGCMMYGTGWYYRPWWGHYYYPRPATWGFHVRYNPWYGWSFGVSYSNGPFHLTIGTGGSYGWWGPGWYRPYPWYGYRHGYRAGYHQGYWQGYWRGAHAGASRPPTGGARPRPATLPSNNIYNRAENANKVVDTRDKMARKHPNVAQDHANNVLTDRDGNIYRRNQDGTWDRRDKGGWSTTDLPSVETRPATGAQTRPSTPQTRPSTPQTRPSTPQTRPSTPQTRPSTPQTRPSTGIQPQPSTRPQQRSYTRPSTGSSVQRDYSARQQGSTRSQQYRSTRPAGGMSRPSPGVRRR
jgi:hypothetical protein